VHLVGFIVKNVVMMHGHMNVKFLVQACGKYVYHCAVLRRLLFSALLDVVR